MYKLCDAGGGGVRVGPLEEGERLRKDDSRLL
jgi:hypothetical protein